MSGGGAFLSGSGALIATPDRLEVRLDAPGKAVIKYRCLRTLAVDIDGVKLSCASQPREPIGFISIDVEPGAPLEIPIVNRGLLYCALSALLPTRHQCLQK